MRMPGFSAEASLYERSLHFGLGYAQTVETDSMWIVPAQTFDSSIPNMADLSGNVFHGLPTIPDWLKCQRRVYQLIPDKNGQGHIIKKGFMCDPSLPGCEQIC
jgi:hypothetical protein